MTFFFVTHAVCSRLDPIWSDKRFTAEELGIVITATIRLQGLDIREVFAEGTVFARVSEFRDWIDQKIARN